MDKDKEAQVYYSQVYDKIPARVRYRAALDRGIVLAITYGMAALIWLGTGFAVFSTFRDTLVKVNRGADAFTFLSSPARPGINRTRAEVINDMLLKEPVKLGDAEKK